MQHWFCVHLTLSQYKAGLGVCQSHKCKGFILAEVIILQAKKKPKGQPLSDWDKQLNSWHAALRVRMEHVIGGVKRYRLVQDKIRCWKKGFRDLAMEICCGLHNFRLNFRPWHYPPLQLHLATNF